MKCTCRTRSWIQILGLLLGLDDGAHTKDCDLIVNKDDKTIKEVRETLNISPSLRIGQHIYNLFRDYEKGDVGNKGIDIFYVGDDEFIKRINQK